MYKTMGKRALRWISILAVLTMWLALAVPIHANGAPVDIYLSYLPEVSNWGPRTATGHAVVAVGDGEVALEVKGLPTLKDEHYEAWLESRAERKLYSAGKFKVGTDGIGRLQVLLDTLPYQEYRMLLVTVEPEPDPSPEPDARRSIAGLFPNTAVIQTTKEITDTTHVETPPYLPVTGRDLSRWATTLAAFGVGVVAGAGVLRWAYTKEVRR
ncbi:MAG: hypothetical protein IT330_04605 [Anaerolineae bacterium]|nr:hypothetical protein [Anaerolineae bacterium]